MLNKNQVSSKMKTRNSFLLAFYCFCYGCAPITLSNRAVQEVSIADLNGHPSNNLGRTVQVAGHLWTQDALPERGRSQADLWISAGHAVHAVDRIGTCVRLGAGAINPIQLKNGYSYKIDGSVRVFKSRTVSPLSCRSVVLLIVREAESVDFRDRIEKRKINAASPRESDN